MSDDCWLDTGDVVLVNMPAEWHPELGIRIYPAVVLYRNGNYGEHGLDVQVFCSPYHVYDKDGQVSDHITVTPGNGPGQYGQKAGVR